MKSKSLLPGIFFLCLSSFTQAQQFATFSGNTLTLDNGFIKRVILLGSGKYGIVSSSMMLKQGKEEFLIPGSEEFYFEINGNAYTGLDDWKLISVENVTGENKGSGAKVLLEKTDINLRICILYMLYPGLPVIRKKIEFISNSSTEMKLEAIDIERLRFEGSESGTDCWVMNDYARQKSLGQFIGNWYDPVVVVHEADKRRGMVLGNEAPGVMKRTTAFLQPNLLTTGLTFPDQNFGFRKWIKAGKSWESTWVFTGIYENSDDPYAILNGVVNDFVRKYLGIRLSEIPAKPVFVYNTYIPFYLDINEKLIYELIDATAECGIEEFVIDAGWQESYGGDSAINKERFPNGLKPIFDYIKSKGMKPGLWLSIGMVGSGSKVFKENPEWLVRNFKGDPISVHDDIGLVDGLNGEKYYTMCMTTGWYNYIKGVILNFVKEYGLEYLKGDLAVVTGAYTTDKTRSGCHAKNHPHADRNESLFGIYQATWQLFDDLHKEAPGLFIDCTFETMGAMHLIDLDMCKHAEGNWLSNFGEYAPLGSLRARQLSWWRSPVIPSTAMVIGNLRLDDPDFELSMMSLAGSLPIVLGDARQLTQAQRTRVKSWADWLKKTQEKHDFLMYRQDLSGFGEPSEGSWDGYQRINSETHSGGIVGIFRQAAAENQRTIFISNLDPDALYDVMKAPMSEKITTAKGKDLAEKGFSVVFEKKYDGAVFSVNKVVIRN